MRTCNLLLPPLVIGNCFISGHLTRNVSEKIENPSYHIKFATVQCQSCTAGLTRGHVQQVTRQTDRSLNHGDCFRQMLFLFVRFL